MVNNNLDRGNDYKHFYDEVSKYIYEYIEDISKIGFSLPEVKNLSSIKNDIEGMIKAVKIIIDSSLELNNLLEHSPDSIYVADGFGETIRVNKAFENTGAVKRADVLGKNVLDLEKEGVFRPSVCGLVLKEKRSLSVLQEMAGGKETIVSGVPLFDNKGRIYRVITNARLLSDINNNIKAYLDKSKQNYNSDAKTYEEGIIAESPAMKNILKSINQILDVDSTIILYGESGVGKGVLAKYIHNRSKRARGRLIEINCGAIPETLLESELFGYESGAFTGAGKKGKPGLIELADGGTLLLDEISELPLMLQVKLLHFIQNRKITRVGGTKQIPIDTRIIAATNKNLKEQVEKGNFRLDLFYRINVIPIEIQPLRERKEDIEPAARYFIDYYKRKYNKEFKINKDFINEIMEHDWPGNMRELENYIERVVVTNKINDPIQKYDEDDIDSENNINVKNLKEALENLERRMVTEAYEKYKNSYKVAEVLGISQASAHRKIAKYTND